MSSKSSSGVTIGNKTRGRIQKKPKKESTEEEIVAEKSLISEILNESGLYDLNEYQSAIVDHFIKRPREKDPEFLAQLQEILNVALSDDEDLLLLALTAVENDEDYETFYKSLPFVSGLNINRYAETEMEFEKIKGEYQTKACTKCGSHYFDLNPFQGGGRDEISNIRRVCVNCGTGS